MEWIYEVAIYWPSLNSKQITRSMQSMLLLWGYGKSLKICPPEVESGRNYESANTLLQLKIEH